MTDPSDAPAAAPAGQQPAQAPGPAPPAAPSPESPTAEGLSVSEQTELGQLLAKRDAAAAGAGASSLKVEPPHSAFSYGGVTVASEFTDVPALMAAAVVEAAAEAGVTITQET